MQYTVCHIIICCCSYGDHSSTVLEAKHSNKSIFFIETAEVCSQPEPRTMEGGSVGPSMIHTGYLDPSRVEAVPWSRSHPACLWPWNRKYVWTQFDWLFSRSGNNSPRPRRAAVSSLRRPSQWQLLSFSTRRMKRTTVITRLPSWKSCHYKIVEISHSHMHLLSSVMSSFSGCGDAELPFRHKYIHNGPFE